jgi:hypothetical protein
LEKHPGRHAEHDEIRRRIMEDMLERGMYERPSVEARKKSTTPEEIPAD